MRRSSRRNVSALASTLPSRLSEKFLIVAVPLKPPASRTWVGERALGRRGCATRRRGSGREELAEGGIEKFGGRDALIRSVGAARDQHVTGDGNRGLDILNCNLVRARRRCACGRILRRRSTLTPLMHPLAASRPINPATLSAARAVRARRGVVSGYFCKRARLQSSLYVIRGAGIRRISGEIVSRQSYLSEIEHDEGALTRAGGASSPGER